MSLLMGNCVFSGRKRSQRLEGIKGSSGVQGKLLQAQVGLDLTWEISCCLFFSRGFVFGVFKAAILSVFKGSSGTTWRHRRNWQTGRSCELTLHAWFDTGLRSFVHFSKFLNIGCPTKGEKGHAGYEGIPGFQGVKVFILHFSLLVCFNVLLQQFDLIPWCF